MDLAIVLVWQCCRWCFFKYIYLDHDRYGVSPLQVLMKKVQTLILLMWTLTWIGKRKRVWKCVRRQGFQRWLLTLCPLVWCKRCWALVFKFCSNFWFSGSQSSKHFLGAIKLYIPGWSRAHPASQGRAWQGGWANSKLPLTPSIKLRGASCLLFNPRPLVGKPSVNL